MTGQVMATAGDGQAMADPPFLQVYGGQRARVRPPSTGTIAPVT